MKVQIKKFTINQDSLSSLFNGIAPNEPKNDEIILDAYITGYETHTSPVVLQTHTAYDNDVVEIECIT